MTKLDVCQSPSIQNHYDTFWQGQSELVPCYVTSLWPVFRDMGLNQSSLVLDIGCGNGSVGKHLIKSYGCRVFGTELSRDGIKQSLGNGYSAACPSEFDSDLAPFPEYQFDIVVISAVVEHVYDPAMLLRQAYRSLKPGGKIVVLTPNVTWIFNRMLFLSDQWHSPWLGGTQGHIRYLNKHQLRNTMVDEGFRDLDWSYSVCLAVDDSQTHLLLGNTNIPISRNLINRRVKNKVSLWAQNFVVVASKPIAHGEKRPPELTPARKLNILQLAGTDRGATWMVEQLAGLGARGHKVTAAVSGEGSTARALHEKSIPYHTLSLRLDWSHKGFWTVFRDTFKLAKFLFKNRFDIVHYHLFESTLIGRIASWIADVPVRINMVAGPFYMEAYLPRLMEKKLSWMDTRIVASCRFTKNLYEQAGAPQDKLDLIYYGPDARLFDPALASSDKFRKELGVDPFCPLIGMVAFFYPPLVVSDFHPKKLWGASVKDHETLIDSVPFVLVDVPEAKFVLVGDGWGDAGSAYIESLKQRTRDLGVEDSIIFAGYRTDIADVLSSLDVSVQCSTSENLGGTIESLLMARPLVVSAVGGMVDSVKHGKTGLTVNPRDPRDLAAAILRLIENPSDAQKMGDNGRSLMLERFSLATTVDSLEMLYLECARKCTGEKVVAARDTGYRLPVVFIRALLALPIIGWLAWTIHGSNIRNRCHWWLRVNLWERPIASIANLIWNQPISLLTGRRRAVVNYPQTPSTDLVMALRKRSNDGTISRLCYLIWKRFSDIALALAIFAVTLPIWITILLSRLLNKLPATERTAAIGRFNKPFCLHTFGYPPQEPGANSFQQIESPSVSPQRWIWWLPMLLNVLNNNMSIVGPRIRQKSSETTEDESWHMKPGLVGWSQVNFSDQISDVELDEMDRLYMATSSPILDLKIMLKAVLANAEQLVR